VTLGPTTPILRIFDEAKALEFYVDYLGFMIDWRHRFAADFPLYMQASRGDCVLHLSEHHGDATPGSATRIRTGSVDALCTELANRSYRLAKPSVETAAWGERFFSLVDPFGNRLTFFEPRSTP
jgi:uncharacterized glyoxalase superfamily protein PhnB